VAAHTIVVGAAADQKISGRQADVILAAYWAVQAALRLLKSGANVSPPLLLGNPPLIPARNGLSAAILQRLNISTLAKISCGSW